VSLSKYGRSYRGWVDYSGQMAIAIERSGANEVLIKRDIDAGASDKSVELQFANVDHKLVLQYGKEKLSYDMGTAADAMGKRQADIEPQAKIFGSGELRLSHIALFKDIYYTQVNNNGRRGRATEGNAFQLAEDEFFVLGDNSPMSEDCRWWSRPGKGNGDRKFPKGVVPREYLAGKAMLVYWPAGFKPSDKLSSLPHPFSLLGMAWVSNFGEMRFIYGGASEEY
jgi:signal peptidase I